MHEKERENAANDEWHDGSVETVITPKMKKVNAVEDGGYARIALIEPPTAPPMAAVAGFAAARGFGPLPSKLSFAA